jgi:hypothetical protein
MRATLAAHADGEPDPLWYLRDQLRAPGHDRPKRARAYLLSDHVVAATAAHYAHSRPRLDHVSLRAIDSPSRPYAPSEKSGPAPANPPATADAPETTDDALWLALCAAPDQGTDVAELMLITGWKRTKLYRNLQQHAEAGRAIRVSGGRWRARTSEDRSP